MGIKFRWPIYRPFKMTEAENAKARAMLNDAKEGKVSYQIPKTLSADELKMIEEAIVRDVVKQSENIAHNRPTLAGLGYKMGAGVSSREPIPPLTRTMKDSEEKPSNSPNEQEGGTDPTLHSKAPNKVILNLIKEQKVDRRFYRVEQNMKTLLLRLEDVESQLEGTFFGKDSENRPINLLAEDVADLKKMMVHVVAALEGICDPKEPVGPLETTGKKLPLLEEYDIESIEEAILAIHARRKQELVKEAVEEIPFVSQADRIKIGEAFKLIIGSLESGFGDVTEESMEIVESCVQHAFKIYPDLEMHPPLSQARFLYGLCTQPMTIFMALRGQGHMPYFLNVDVNVAMAIASDVFGYMFLGGKAVSSSFAT